MRCATAVLALAPALFACSGATQAAPPRDVDVVVVTIDTLRADVVGCYGDEGGHTPNLDALAARGARFSSAIAPMATTFPSHASMFTGAYPRRHGVRWNGHQLGDEWTTLAEVLQGAGYQTGAFVSYRAMLANGSPASQILQGAPMATYSQPSGPIARYRHPWCVSAGNWS